MRILIVLQDDRIHRNPERLPEVIGGEARTKRAAQGLAVRKICLKDPCGQVAMASTDQF